MTEPFNLDALAVDGADEPFRFVHGGDTYELPPRLDLRVVAALADGRIFDALRTMLGDEQWAKVQQSEAVFDDLKLRGLLDAYAQHTGTSVGESNASLRSSSSTARPSKRTSKGTTKLR